MALVGDTTGCKHVDGDVPALPCNHICWTAQFAASTAALKVTAFLARGVWRSGTAQAEESTNRNSQTHSFGHCCDGPCLEGDHSNSWFSARGAEFGGNECCPTFV